MIKKKFLFGKNWFFENIIPGESPTRAWGFLVDKKIYSGKSKFQKIDVFETEKFGKILVLDDFIQLSTRHEFVYHEMLVHPAFFCHKNPEKILIVGGGDGGVLREVVKYGSVKEILMVDIDKKVTEISKKYLSSVPEKAFSDKRLRLFNGDALSFVKKYKNYFDIIIDDLTDPSGPSLFLWNRKFYRDISEALKKDGIASFQTAYLNEKFATSSREEIKKVFRYFRVHKAYVGCFPFDEHTFSLASEGADFKKNNYKTVKKKFQRLKIKTRYYNPKVHFSSVIF